MSKYKKTPIIDWTGHIVGFECKPKEIKIMICEKSEADVIIMKHHYSKKATKVSFKSFIVYYKNKVSGALQIGFGIRPQIKGVFNPEEMLEFDRMWLNDEMPKFSETITLSLLHNYIKKCLPKIKWLISYSDTSVGNFGTIYKAANYQLLESIKSDFYILESGERIHPVTMWHRHGTRQWHHLQKIYPNIKKAEGHQLKFIYYLH
jgi:hypothetical protein